MTDELNLEQLKALAQAATPGPWTSQEPGEEYRTSYWSVRCPSKPSAVSHELCRLMSTNAGEDADAAYIAAANPATVLALIAEIERLRTTQPAPIPVQAGDGGAMAEIERLREYCRTLNGVINRFHAAFGPHDDPVHDNCIEKIRGWVGAGGQGGEDGARLDFMAHHGMALRNDPKDRLWFLVAPYHTGTSCVDDFQRFDSARAAIDAAITAKEPK